LSLRHQLVAQRSGAIFLLLARRRDYGKGRRRDPAPILKWFQRDKRAVDMQTSDVLNMKSLRGNLVWTVCRHPEWPALTYRANRRPGRRAYRDWHTLTWYEFALLVAEVADGLDELCDAGAIVAVLSGNDARYPVLEQAVIVSGRSLQPLYTSSSDDDLLRAIATTGANVLVAGDDQRDRLREGALSDALTLGSVAVVELSALVSLPNTGGRPRGVLGADPEPFHIDRVKSRLCKWPERPGADAVLFLQTTGTTGPAQVIEISQTAVLAAMQALPDEVLHIHPKMLSFLPTAHISERLVVGYLAVALAGHTWVGAGLESLATDLMQCKPSMLLAPPAVLDAIRSETIASASKSWWGRGLLKSIAADAERNSGCPLTGPRNRRLRSCFFGWLVRRTCGLSRADVAIAGTAPLPRELHAWWETLGLKLRNVYGQTEVSGATSMTRPAGSIRSGVGRPLSGVEVRVADSGELQVRSPAIFTRYVGDDARTARAFDSGWFKTGDRAHLTDDGELVLLGRIQSMIPTPGGGIADMTDLTNRITSAIGPADVTYFSDSLGLYLYIAVHPKGVPRHVLMERGILDPVPVTDPLAEVLESQLYGLPAACSIAGFALFRGGFGYRDGEVGPTGKARGWRIHQLRKAHLRQPATAQLSRHSEPQQLGA
jgi:long-chain acyl-CoA synthetase